MKLKTLALFFAACYTLNAAAQGSGQIKIEGYTVHLDKKGKKSPVADANVIVYKGGEKSDEIKSDKKGKYGITLDYGAAYKIACEGNDGLMDMCFAIDGKIPPAKQDIKATVAMDFILLDKDNPDIDTLKFKFPYTKLKFDGNKKFVDDEKYLMDFTKGMFKEYKEAQKKVKQDQADKAAQSKADAGLRFLLVVGKLLAGDPAKVPVRNMKVNLVNEKGVVVETATTDKFGKFSFTKLAADRNYFIKMDENDSAKLAGTKITMYNKYGKKLMVTSSDTKGGFKFELLGSDKMTISDLEVEDNGLLIAGTLEALLNGKSQPLAKSRVVLANPLTNEIYQVVETDENGKFVFSKLPPDKNFIIRLEEGSSELANIKITLKDKAGNEIISGDADGFGKFRFELLASDKEMMNNFEVEENQLKMDLAGKLLNGESNAVLANLKVNLLDDRGTVLNTTTTNDKGLFVFKNLILYGGYFFELDSNDPALNGVNSFVLAMSNNKAIKEYDITNKTNTKQRLLESDQKNIGRLYLK